MSEFIYDRTEVDVANAQYFFTTFWGYLTDEEKQEWLAGLKGCFNYTDYNRLAEIVNNLGDYSLSTDLTMSTMPNKTLIESLLEAIKELRSVFGGYVERSGTPDEVLWTTYPTYLDTSANFLKFDRLNTFEQSLWLSEKIANNEQISFPMDFEIVEAEDKTGSKTLTANYRSEKINVCAYSTLNVSDFVVSGSGIWLYAYCYADGSQIDSLHIEVGADVDISAYDEIAFSFGYVAGTTATVTYSLTDGGEYLQSEKIFYGMLGNQFTPSVPEGYKFFKRQGIYSTQAGLWGSYTDTFFTAPSEVEITADNYYVSFEIHSDTKNIKEYRDGQFTLTI